MTEEGIKFMHDEFDFHDFDEQLKRVQEESTERVAIILLLTYL